MNLGTSRFDKFLFWFIFFALLIAFALLSHVALAQHDVDINGVVNKSFNTNADNVYGILVGLLTVLVAITFSIVGYLIRFIIKFLPQLNHTLQQNTKAFEDLETTIKNVVTNEVKAMINASEQNIIREILRSSKQDH